MRANDLYYSPLTSGLTCARCRAPVEQAVEIARTEPDAMEVALRCHGVTKRVRITTPSSYAQGEINTWYASARRTLEDAFKPFPAFRIRMRPHVRTVARPTP